MTFPAVLVTPVHLHLAGRRRAARRGRGSGRGGAATRRDREGERATGLHEISAVDIHGMILLGARRYLV